MLFDVTGSQGGNGRYCGGNHLDGVDCDVLGIRDLFKKILKNQNMVKYQLLTVKDSKAERFALLHS